MSGAERLRALLDGIHRVLVVHAHPDDETLSTGALLAGLVDRGVEVTLVTATRGERGEVVDGPLAYLEGSPELAAHREGELRGALRELGVTGHAWLGRPPARAQGLEPRDYVDSGMRWIREGLAGPADDASPESLTSAQLDEVVADLAAAIAATDAELVVSYNEIGGYGHPDHVRSREAALAAARRADVPFAEIVPEPGDDVAWFDLDELLGQVARALSHHATQLTVHGDELVHSGGQREPIRASVGLRLVRDPA